MPQSRNLKTRQLQIRNNTLNTVIILWLSVYNRFVQIILYSTVLVKIIFCYVFSLTDTFYNFKLLDM